MVILLNLHAWSFILIHVLSLPPLVYKRRPGHPLPPHTISQAFFFSFPSPTVPRESLSSACQFHPATEPSVHSLISNDLATKILQTFSSRCNSTSPTTYPKIIARGIPMQSGSDPSWLLPCVCKHSVHTTEIPI
jgi:hypothetical protein